MIFIELYITAFVFNLLAWAITMWDVNKHGPDCEGNPVARFFIRKKISLVLLATLPIVLLYLYSLALFLGQFAVLVIGSILLIVFGWDLSRNVYKSLCSCGFIKTISAEYQIVNHVPNMEVFFVFSRLWGLH